MTYNNTVIADLEQRSKRIRSGEQIGWAKMTIAGTAIAVFFSALTGYLNFGVLYLFGIPLLGLLIGLLLVWFSKASYRRKIVITLLPIPIAALFFFLFIRINTGQSETYLLPKDFRGEFVVFYEEPCGQHEETDNQGRVYRISETGVLITRSQSVKGFLNRSFFFVDEEGGKSEFPEFQRQDFETEQKKWNVFHKSPVEQFSRETVGAFWKYGPEYVFASNRSEGYIVSNYQDFETKNGDQSKRSKDFRKKATDILNECRERGR